MTPMTTALAAELRDTVLQDLVAVGMLVRLVQDNLDGDGGAPAHQILDQACAVLHGDLHRLRSLIDRLGPPA